MKATAQDDLPKAALEFGEFHEVPFARHPIAPDSAPQKNPIVIANKNVAFMVVCLPASVLGATGVPFRVGGRRPPRAGASSPLVLARQLTPAEVVVMRLVPFPRLPSRHRSGKVLSWLLGAVALGLLACCGSAVFFAMKSREQQEAALAEADKLYASKPAEAVVKYKEGYPAAGSRKAEVLQRIVDHEAKAGNTAEATKWIEKGLDDKLAVDYTVPAAKDLHAKVQKDRADKEAAKKAAEEAKKAEREAKAKEQPGKNRKYTRDEFKNLVVGKSKSEVVALLGRPKATQQSGDLELWDYPNRTTDPVTGKTDDVAQVEFEGDRVANVSFIRL
jgi:hypothetical protein